VTIKVFIGLNIPIKIYAEEVKPGMLTRAVLWGWLFWARSETSGSLVFTVGRRAQLTK
jgi:hypothetical protein